MFVVELAAQNSRDSLFMQQIADERLVDSTAEQRFDNAFYAAEALKNRSNFTAAIEGYRRCLAIDSTNAAAWFELSKMYSFVGNTDMSYRILLKAVKYAPRNDYYKEIQAAYCVSNKEYDKAIRIFERLSKANKSKTSYLYSLLKLYEAVGNDKKYIATIRKIETLNGISEETTIAKINYFNRKNQPKKAIAEIDALTDKYPYNIDYKTYTAQYYLTIGDTAAALVQLDRLKSKYPNSGYVYMTFLRYYNAKNDQKQAERCMAKIIDDTNIDISEKLDIFITHIDLLEKNEQHDKAKRFFHTLIDVYPKESSIYTLYGAYLIDLKDTVHAEDVLNTAVSLNPDDESSWSLLAQIYIANDSIDKLMKIADEAESLFPDNSTWAYYKVMGLIQQGKQAEAIALIDFYVDNLDSKQNGFKSLIIAIKGDFMLQDSLYTEAFACYERAIEYNPNNVIALNNYAYYLAVCNTDLAKAEKMSSKTIIAEPKNGTYIDTYAWILFRQGDLNGAKLHIERALLYGDDPDVLEHYGDILFKLGDEQKALEQWQKSKDKGNASPTLQKKLDHRRYIESPVKCK